MTGERSGGRGEAPPSPVVGIVGGGQLARMMYQAAISLDCRIRVLSERPDDSAAQVAADVTVGDWHDQQMVADFASTCDVITFDHELVPVEILEAVESAGALLRPSASAMRRASGKAEQRHLALEAGIAVAPHHVVTDVDGLRAAVADLGLPVVAKATRGGYDGRGVRWLRSPADVDQIADDDFTATGPLLIEPDLDITAELATLVVRGTQGDPVLYPVVVTEQNEGICTTVTAPASTDLAGLADQAHDAALRLAEMLDYVGLLAIELFVVDGALLLNELAPRPHNSGHYTIDACVTSQFENHVRAVLGAPLGDAGLVVPTAVMANIIATDHEVAAIASVDVPSHTSVHLYGKAPRPGRKIGHVTACGDHPAELREAAVGLARQLATPPPTTPVSSMERQGHA